jgi:hypothetical protein
VSSLRLAHATATAIRPSVSLQQQDNIQSGQLPRPRCLVTSNTFKVNDLATDFDQMSILICDNNMQSNQVKLI